MSKEKLKNLKYMHDWYVRAADCTKIMTGGNSTAAELLKYYLNPKNQSHDHYILAHCQNDIEYQDGNHFGKKINTNAGTYVLDDNYLAKVKEVTEYNTDMEKRKKKFLSEEKNLTGIIKKIQSNGVLQNEYKLYWYSTIGLSETLKNSLLEKAWNFDPSKDKLTAEEQNQLDVYAGLNTFIIRSDVIVEVNNIKLKTDCNGLKFESVNRFNIESINVSIKSWKNTIFDYYDFNGNIGFFLLNPDYGNKEEVYPNKVKLTPLDVRHNLLVNMTKEIPPLAREFYIYKEFYENNQNLLVKNYGIKWREA
ncbi:MAG: hypothetical protein Q4P16_11740 [Spirochaetales bacterium]|nr:hypothetical protein [Spirochaetales bacterium]